MVEVQFAHQNMPVITVTPAITSFDHTGGLCGWWNNNTDKELYVLDKEGFPVYQDLKDLDRFDEFWK